jgi:ankyrin repeat protein
MLRRRFFYLGILLLCTVGGLQLAFANARQRPLDRSLLAAAEADDVGLAQLLLRKGADPNVMHPSHVKLAEWALVEGRSALANALLEAGAAVDVSYHVAEAASTANWAVVQVLLEHGADPNMRVGKKQTSLLLAVADAGDMDTLKALLERRVDLNARDAQGRTARMRAADAGVEDDFEKLLVAQAQDLNAVDADGKTALIHAVIHDDSMIGWLLPRGVDRNVRDRQGRTALDYARSHEARYRLSQGP